RRGTGTGSGGPRLARARRCTRNICAYEIGLETRQVIAFSCRSRPFVYEFPSNLNQFCPTLSVSIDTVSCGRVVHTVKRPINGESHTRSLIWGGLVLLLATMWLLFAYFSQQQMEIARIGAMSTASTLTKLVEGWALSSLSRINDLAVSVSNYLAAVG